MGRPAILASMLAGVLLLGLLSYLLVRRSAGRSVETRESSPAPSFEVAVAQCGLGEKLAALRSSVLPSIRLRTLSPGAVLPGRSKLGGRPDLPSSVAWPERNGKPMSFLAQLALAELAPLDSTRCLPHSGWLCFFHADQGIWGFDPKDVGGWAVIHVEGEPRELAPRELPAGVAADARFTECSLAFEREETLPPLESAAGAALGIADSKQDEAYSKLCDALVGGSAQVNSIMHRVLGWPDPIQGDMQLECQLASNGLYCGDGSGYADPRRAALEPGATEWQLLFQIDSEEKAGMMWGDAGRVYFWIRKQDLAARRFDRVWCILQCS